MTAVANALCPLRKTSQSLPDVRTKVRTSEAILKARSPRLSVIARQMPGSETAAYKALQRFLACAEPQAALERLFQPAAPFVIGDPTEMPRRGPRRRTTLAP
jgi:hypothetical protein